MADARLVSGDEVIRALERLGFHRAVQRGIHVVMERKTTAVQRRCVVPLQEGVPAKALMGILRQADVTEDEFYRHL
ncbi:MAG: type II toxin-antitoxin system HicA family toxin [Chloroflexota bacterium]